MPPEEGHEACSHGEGGTCYVGYAALHKVIFDPSFPFERFYGDVEDYEEDE